MKPFNQTITYTSQDGQQIQLKWLASKRNKHIRVSIAAGKVRVSSPPRIKWPMIEQFLRQQEAWLLAHIPNLTQLESTDSKLLFQGESYQIQLLKPPQSKRVWLENGVCYVAPLRPEASAAPRTLERWLKTRAVDQLTPLFLTTAKQMEEKVDHLRWRDTRSRWGSCSSSGEIMLSWRLIHAPTEIARYVIVHELAHRTHHDHSSKFWQLVEKFDPAYKLHRGWLKRNGHLCQTPII